MDRYQFKENVILIDAAFVDDFAGKARSHFSKQMGQIVPVGAIADFLVCTAISAAMPEVEQGSEQQEIQVVMVCGKEAERFENFNPSDFLSLDAHAFMSKKHGEFQISMVRDIKLYENAEPLMVESSKLLMDDKNIKRLVIVNHPDDYEAMSEVAAKVDGKDIKLMVVPPAKAKNPDEAQQFMNVILYSMGLRSVDLEAKFAYAFDYETK